MKIYGEGIYQNDRADLVGLAYINIAIERVEKGIEWLTTSESPCQHILAEIDILLMLGEKFPHDINIKLKKSKIQAWQKVFDDWLQRNQTKIPKRYQNSLKNDAEQLFQKLSKFGHSLEWL